jgi:hypothetical protein
MAAILIPIATAGAVSLIALLLTPLTPQNLRVPGSSYGQAIPRPYGTCRLEGNWIFPIKARDAFVKAGSKKGKGGLFSKKGQAPKAWLRALALFGEGPAQFEQLILNGTIYYSNTAGTINYNYDYGGMGGSNQWASQYATFFDGYPAAYPGYTGYTQEPWSHCQEVDGVDSTPAYSKMIMAGFYPMPLDKFGNSFPSTVGAIVTDREYGANPRLGDVVRDICAQANIDFISGSPPYSYTVDASELDAVHISGFIFRKGATGFKEALTQLMTTYLFYEVLTPEGVTSFRFFNRGSDTGITIPPGDFCARDGVGPNGVMNIERTEHNPIDLPSLISFKFKNSDILHNPDAVYVHADWATHVNEFPVETDLTLTLGTAEPLAKAMLEQVWKQRIIYKFFLPPSYIKTIPGDLFILPNGETVQVEKSDVGVNFIVEVQAHSYSPSGYSASGSFTNSSSTITTTTRNQATTYDTGFYLDPITQTVTEVYSDVYFLDIPLISDTVPNGTESGTYVVATVAGTSLAVSTDGGATFASGYTTNYPGVIGTITGTLGAFSGTGVDTTNTLSVTLNQGTLESINSTQLNQFNLNIAFVGSYNSTTGATTGEIIAFETATLVSGTTYTLSNLLRGQRGTSDFINTHSSGEIFFLLQSSDYILDRLPVDPKFIGTNLQVKGALSNLQDFSTLSTHYLTFQDNSLKPYPQTGGNLTYDYANNIIIQWTKKTRGKGLILGEENDNYSIDILNGTTVVRTVNITIPYSYFAYSVAEQMADFGAIQTSLSVNIYKVSSIVGRGYIYHLSSSVGANTGGTLVAGDPATEAFKGSKTLAADYTLVVVDNGLWLLCTTPITLTISNTLPLGFRFYVVNESSGNVTIAGTGITFTTGYVVYSQETALVVNHGNAFTVDTPIEQSAATLIKVNSSDTHPDYLINKLVDTFGSIFNIVTIGGIPRLQISSLLNRSLSTWNIVFKSSPYTASNGDEVVCDTSGATFAITLPAPATIGDTILKITDAFKTDTTSTTQGFGKNKLTLIAPSGYTIYNGTAFDINRSSISPEFKLYGTDWAINGGTVR